MNISDLVDPTYWFTFSPARVGGVTGTSIFVFFLLVFIGGIILAVLGSNKQRDKYQRMMLSRWSSLCSTIGILGVLFYFFSYERIQFFGARFWYAFLVLGAIIWVHYILRFQKNEIPRMKEKTMQRKAQNAYMPTGKKRKKKRR